jgi:class 3 adenylate cyclase
MADETTSAVMALFPECAALTMVEVDEASCQRKQQQDPVRLVDEHRAGGNDLLEDGMTAMRRQIAELVLERTQLRRRVIEQSETITALRRSVCVQGALVNASPRKFFMQQDQRVSGGDAAALIGQPASPTQASAPLYQGEQQQQQPEASTLISSPTSSMTPRPLRRASSDLSRQLAAPTEAAVVTAKWNMELLDLVELLQATIKQQAERHAAELNRMETALAEENASNRRLTDELHACKARLADEVLQRTRLHRLEQAAARLTGPRRIREGGLARLEASERATMAVYDDLYYVQRCDGLTAPVRSVSMVFLCMVDLDVVQQQSPEYVPFMVKMFLTAAQQAATVWNGYRMAQHKVFTGYAFRSPSAAVNFAADVHVALLHVKWPDPILHIKNFREIREGKEMIFCGPRIFSCVYHGNPVTEINETFGTMEYCGRETIAAVQMLTQHARAGEILCNGSWMTEYQAEQHLDVSQQPPPLASPQTALPGAPVGREIRGFDVEERPHVDLSFSSFPVSATSSANQQVLSGVAPGTPSTLQPHALPMSSTAAPSPAAGSSSSAGSFWSLVPVSLKKRRRGLSSQLTNPPTSTDDQLKAGSDPIVASLAMTIRMTNGRLHGNVPEEIRRWQAKRERSKDTAQARKKNNISTSSSVLQASGSLSRIITRRGSAAPSAFAPPQNLLPFDDATKTHLAPGTRNDSSTLSKSSSAAMFSSETSSPLLPQKKEKDSRSPRSNVTTSFPPAAAPSQSSPNITSAASLALNALSHSTVATASGVLQIAPNTRQLQLSKMGQKTSEAMERLLMMCEDSATAAARRLPGVGSVVAACCVDLVNGKKLRRLQTAVAGEGGAAAPQNSATAGGSAPPNTQPQLSAAAALGPSAQPLSTPTTTTPGSHTSPFSFEESIDQMRQLISIACQLHGGSVIASSNDDVAVVVFSSTLLAFRFAAYMQMNAATSIRCMAALPAKEILPEEPMIRCGIAVGTVGAALSAPAAVVARGNRFLKLAARICSAAHGGEILASGDSVRSFRSVTAQLISTEFAIVGRGMKLLPQLSGCATEIFSLQPSALAFRHRLLLANTAPIPPIVMAAPLASGGSGQLGPAAVTSSIDAQVLARSNQTAAIKSPANGALPLQSSPSVAQQSLSGTLSGTLNTNSSQQQQQQKTAKGAVTIQLIQALEGREFQKIMAVFTSAERRSFAEYGDVPAAKFRAAQLRLERMESDLMRLHDTAGISVVPPSTSASSSSSSSSSLSGEDSTLVVLYCDVESSAKLLEACGENFVRSQQHYCRLALDIFSSYDGYVVKATMFEAFIVVFRSARAAVEAACELQLQLLSSDWPPELLKCERALKIRDARTQAVVYNGLRVRIGVSMGRLQSSFLPQTKRVDFQGPAVALAVRLGRSAPGGEIWVQPEVVESVSNVCSAAGLISPLENFAFQSVQDVGSRQNELLAISIFSPQTALRMGAKLMPDRRERIANSSDANAWWRSATSCNNKPPAVKYVPGSKRKVPGPLGVGNLLSSAGSSFGPPSPLVGGSLLVAAVEAISQKLEAVVEHTTLLISGGQSQQGALSASFASHARRASGVVSAAEGTTTATPAAAAGSPTGQHPRGTPHHPPSPAHHHSSPSVAPAPSTAEVLAILRSTADALNASLLSARGAGGGDASGGVASTKSLEESMSVLDLWSGVLPKSPPDSTGTPTIMLVPPGSAGASRKSATVAEGGPSKPGGKPPQQPNGRRTKP